MSSTTQALWMDDPDGGDLPLACFVDENRYDSFSDATGTAHSGFLDGGLDAFTASGSTNKNLFSIANDTYGPTITLPGTYTTGVDQTIYTSAAFANVYKISCKFCISVDNIDDAGVIAIGDVWFSPRRETAYDGARRPYIYVGATYTPIGSSGLTIGTWYQFELVRGSNRYNITITNLSTTATSSYTLGSTLKNIDASTNLVFWCNTSTASSPTCQTKYADIKIYTLDSPGLVVLSMHCQQTTTATNIFDSSGVAKKTLSVTGPLTLTSTDAAFGRTCLSSPVGGGRRYVLANASQDFDFGSEDFTIQAKIKLSALPAVGNNYGIVSYGTDMTIGTVTQRGFVLYVRPNLPDVAFTIASSSGNVGVNTSTGPITLNVWHDIAVVRSGTSILLFVDGELLSSNTFTGSMNALAASGYQLTPCTLYYEYGTTNSDFYGKLGYLRITRGAALWTTTHVVPGYPACDDIDYYGSNGVASLTGIQASAALGAVALTEARTAVSGIAASVAAGNLLAGTPNASVLLTGISKGASLGNVSSGYGIPLTGLGVSAGIGGSLTANNRTIALSGVNVSVLLGQTELPPYPDLLSSSMTSLTVSAPAYATEILFTFQTDGTITIRLNGGSDTFLARWLDTSSSYTLSVIANKYKLASVTSVVNGNPPIVTSPASANLGSAATYTVVNVYHASIPVKFIATVLPTVDNPRYGETHYYGNHTFYLYLTTS